MWRFYLTRHTREIVLKARQYGYTTLLALMNLDDCLFLPNLWCDFIADTRPNAEDIFQRKVRFAWDNWCDPGPGHPEREAYMDIGRTLQANGLGTVGNRADMLQWENGSNFRVATSSRGGTVQRLHVSEFGKIAAHHPERAREIRTGAFNAVPASGLIVVESTAEGQDGAFYRMVQQALALVGREALAAQEFHLFFHAWWEDPTYTTDPALVPIPQRMNDYFDELEASHGIQLTQAQKAWYTLMEATQGEDMWREYPSYDLESFKVSLEGAYLARQMRAARMEQRIGTVPYLDNVPVNTSWDIGVSDETTIWFWQAFGLQYRFIDFLHDSGEGADHYVREIRRRQNDYGWLLGKHLLPHDARVREWGNNGKNRVQSLSELGLRDIEVIQPPQDKVGVGVEAMRRIMPQCWFDETGCERGIACLDNFRKEWDEHRGTWKDKPLRNWAIHGADAYQTFALGYDLVTGEQDQRVPLPPTVSNRAWT